MSRSSATPPKVVVIGGGYGGISVAAGLDDVADVTLIEPKDTFFYNVAALRALVAPEWLPKIFLPYDHLLKNGCVLRDAAVGLDGKRVKLASGHEVSGDFIVLATGSSYPFPAKSDSNNMEEAKRRYVATHQALAAAERVLILGAGAVGLELAGEIVSRWPDKRIIIFDIADDILPGGYRPELRLELRRQLTEMKIELVLGSLLQANPPSLPGQLETFTVRTESGIDIVADIWFRGYGIAPITNYLTDELASLVMPDGFVQVTPYMEIADHDGIYAVGDIAAGHLNGAGRASRQGERVAANIRALITGEGEVIPMPVTPPAIILPLGPEGGAGQRPDQEGLLGPEAVAEIKGRDMMVDVYAKKLGVPEPSPSVQ